ncbi:hypothetical protein [Streptomyces sp. NPDC005046]
MGLDLATGLARDPNEGPGKAVFCSDVTLWLDKQGKDWAASEPTTRPSLTNS